MATVNSDQITRLDASVPSKKLDKNNHGWIRRMYFSYTTTALAIADIIQLVKLPDNARVVGGALINTNLGATTTLSIGITGAATRYLGATATSAAANTPFANTVALNYGDIISVTTGSQGADVYLIATVGGATLTAAQTVTGYVDLLLP